MVSCPLADCPSAVGVMQPAGHPAANAPGSNPSHSASNVTKRFISFPFASGFRSRSRPPVRRATARAYPCTIQTFVY